MKAQVTQLSVKVFLLAMVLTVFISGAVAQNNPITSINISLPANPDANIANWGTGTSQLTISATARTVNGRVDGLAVESKILVIIKKNGAVVCGAYTGNTAPEAGFNTISKVWAGSNALALLGKDCVLPAGDYELTVQFFNARGAVLSPASELKTKPFTIRGNEQQAYQAVQLIAPANNTVFKETDIAKPITFRWTPIVPKPQEPTTYRLKVWQLMQGQTGTQAMRANQPIFTKDVDNITQAVISNLVTGPCKPPYLCEFVWNVQSLNREGKPIGSNNGTSETFSFKVDEGTAVTAGTVKLSSPANGVTIAAGEVPQFSWFPLTTGTGQETYKIKVVVINGDQSPEVALRTNKPIFEKDSMPDLSLRVPLGKFNAGKKYVWNVQALNREGKPIGGNNGTSELFTFKVSEIATTNTGTTKLGSPANNATIPAGEALKFTWLPPVPPTSGQTYKIKIVEIKGDQSPEQAFRTNKPHFEKDSLDDLSFTTTGPQPTAQAFKGNKPHFEKDSLDELSFTKTGPQPTAQAFKGNKPIFEKDSIAAIFTTASGGRLDAQALHTNKPIFEKDSLMYLQVPPNVKFMPGKRYAWAIQAVNSQGKPVGNAGQVSVFKMEPAVAPKAIDKNKRP